jgi:hypothetical protein
VLLTGLWPVSPPVLHTLPDRRLAVPAVRRFAPGRQHPPRSTGRVLVLRGGRPRNPKGPDPKVRGFALRIC